MMRKWLNRNKHPELIESKLYNDQTFYNEFCRDIIQAKKEIIIESPYMTVRRVKSLLPVLRQAVRRKVLITVNTRDSKEHDAYFQKEALEVVALLQDLGISILYTTGHHRKLAIIDRKILWEGSHNILSQNASCEIMRRIYSKRLAEQTIKFIGLNKFL